MATALQSITLGSWMTAELSFIVNTRHGWRQERCMQPPTLP